MSLISIREASLPIDQQFIFHNEWKELVKIPSWSLEQDKEIYPEAMGWIVSEGFSTPLVEETEGDEWEEGETLVVPTSLEEFKAHVLRAFPEGKWEFSQEEYLYRAISPFMSEIRYERGNTHGEWEVRNGRYFYGGAMHKVRLQ